MTRFESRRQPDPEPGTVVTAADGPPEQAGAPRASRDPFLDALESLDMVLAEESSRLHHIRRRIALLQGERAAGRSYAEIIADEPRPRLVEMLADITRELDASGAVVRRTEARALHDAGMTMDEIAVWFGVTRQRVSVLLRDR